MDMQLHKVEEGGLGFTIFLEPLIPEVFTQSPSPGYVGIIVLFYTSDAKHDLLHTW